MLGTIDLVKTRLSEQMLIILTASRAVPGQIDETVIERAGAEADGLIFFHLRGRYPLPLPEPVPPELFGWWLDLVVNALYKGRPEAGEVPESVLVANKEARAILKDIRDGKGELYDKTDTTGPIVEEPSRIEVSTSAKTFGGSGGLLESY
jgi:phage gp36-like protein